MVAWNLAGERSIAGDVDEDEASSSSLKRYLVCIAAPSEDERNPPVSNDGPKIYNANLFREKYDHLICTGPNLGDSVELQEGASFEITAHFMSGFEQTTSGVKSGITLGECNGSQEIVCLGELLIWRPKAVAKNLLNSGGQQLGTISNSRASGGIIMQDGVVRAESAWADPGLGGFLKATISAGNLSASIEPFGNLGSGVMSFDSGDVRWQFAVLDADQLDKFLIEHWDEMH